MTDCKLLAFDKVRHILDPFKEIETLGLCLEITWNGINWFISDLHDRHSEGILMEKRVFKCQRPLTVWVHSNFSLQLFTWHPYTDIISMTWRGDASRWVDRVKMNPDDDVLVVDLPDLWRELAEGKKTFRVIFFFFFFSTCASSNTRMKNIQISKTNMWEHFSDILGCFCVTGCVWLWCQSHTRTFFLHLPTQLTQVDRIYIPVNSLLTCRCCIKHISFRSTH